MTLWADGQVELFNHPTDVNGGGFSVTTPQGFIPAVPVKQFPDADYPLPQFMINFAIAQAATGAAVSIF